LDGVVIEVISRICKMGFAIQHVILKVLVTGETKPYLY
jgi:hypothetical protein